MSFGGRARRLLISGSAYLAIVTVTLVLFDVLCRVLGIFPPKPDYGDPDLGWRTAAPTGEMREDRCTKLTDSRRVTFTRNEDGIRTSKSARAIMADATTARIGVIGDSQTDLCAPNPETHAGVLEASLTGRGMPATALAIGDGRYSPLQGYLAFRKILGPYRPTAMVMNLYTGNDFFDILRVDDRPHFVAADSGYRIAPPVWFVYADPQVQYRSRVLFAAKTLAERTGILPLYLRMRELLQTAREQGSGWTETLGYLGDLRKAREPSLGYPEALLAQMLNQQIYFKRFPAGRSESLRRLRFLLQLARRENPGVLLVMSPLPSYQLVGRRPIDDAMLRTLHRLGITEEQGLRDEESLYRQLRTMATAEGWVFVDNLKALREYHGPERFYNTFDYHLLPPASDLIGRAQAAVLLPRLKAPRPRPRA